ncbi:MAG: Gldg family protein [Chloracidobacterium sp.]|nr:Gldg family protein [Chloracidobacterium sp.]
MNVNRQEITKLASVVGPAMAVAGYILYSREQVWKWYIIALIAVGLALLLASAVLGYKSIAEFFQGRQGKLGANTAVMSVAVIVIIGAINFLGYRHHKRFDLTSEGLYTLSDQTKKIVGSLQKDVKVIKFDKADDQQLADRMDEFKYLSKHISYERVDPQQKPEIARQYAVRQFGVTIVAAGERVERPTQTDEQSMVNAILKVTRDKLKHVCFTEGHGEKGLSAAEGGGYGSVGEVLKNENYEVKSVNLVSSNQVPAECDELIVAGPKKAFLPQESAMIGKYLDEGGKVFMMLDAEPDHPNSDPQLNDVLKNWNIKAGNDVVLDASGAGRLIGLGPAAPIAGDYPDHPITKDMKKEATFFPMARSIKVDNSAKGGGSATELLKTSENSWAETELKGNEAKYDEGKDTKGPISLGVAATRKVGDKEARLVVIGDSDFATDSYIRFYGNGDLFFNTVNWLAQDEDLISIRPKSPTNRNITMTQAQQTTFGWLIALFMPLAVIGSGAYIWWTRR